MNLLTSLIPEPYSTYVRVGVLILLTGGCYVTGYVIGDHHVEYKVQKQIIKEQGQTIYIHDKQNVIDTSAVTDLQKKYDALQAKNDQLQNELAQKPLTVVIPATKTVPAQCYLSQSWVDLYNQSVGTQ